MFKNLGIRTFVGGASLLGLVLAGPADAATGGVACRNQWSSAFLPVIDNITGNAKNLFVVLSIPLVILALVALALLHNTRHRSPLIAVFGFVLLAAIGIVVAPTIINSFTSGVCP